MLEDIQLHKNPDDMILTNSFAYGTRGFNAASNPIPRMDSLFFLRFTLILSSHVRLGLPRGLFPVGVPVKIVK